MFNISLIVGSSRSVNRHVSLIAATAEYGRLQNAYPSVGYEVIILPKVGVVERADFVLHPLAR